MSDPDRSQNASSDQLPSAAFGSAAHCEEDEKLPALANDDSRWKLEAREHSVNVLRDIHTVLARKEEEILKQVNETVAQLRVVSKPASYTKIDKLLKRFRATRKEAQRLNSYRFLQEIKPVHLRQRKDAFARSILDDEHRACKDRCSHESTSCRCSICYETFDNMYTTLPCGHVFHYECTLKWLIRTDTCTCPMCRRNIPQAADGSNALVRSNPTWTEVYGWCDELLAIAPWDLIDNHAAEENSDEDESDEDESDEDSSDEDESDESSDSESNSDESSTEEEESDGGDSVDSPVVDASGNAAPRESFTDGGEGRRGRAQVSEMYIELSARVHAWLRDRQRRRHRLEYVPPLFTADEQQQEPENSTVRSRSSHSSLQLGTDPYTRAGNSTGRDVNVSHRYSNERQRSQRQGRRDQSPISRRDRSLSPTAPTYQGTSYHQEKSPFITSAYGGRRISNLQRSQRQGRRDQSPISRGDRSLRATAPTHYNQSYHRRTSNQQREHRDRSPTYRHVHSLTNAALTHRTQNSPHERSATTMYPTYGGRRSRQNHSLTEVAPTFQDHYTRHDQRKPGRNRSSIEAPPSIRHHNYRHDISLTDTALPRRSQNSHHERFPSTCPDYGGPRSIRNGFLTDREPTFCGYRSRHNTSRCPPISENRNRFDRRDVSRKREMSPPRDPRVYWSANAIQ